MADTPKIILLTGNMASGKSSVAQALAERLPKSVHLRGDIFRKMIVRGRAEMGAELSAEAFEQLELRYRLAADAAKAYMNAGFTVIYQDVIVGPLLDEVVTLYRGVALHVIVLCPTPAIIAVRQAGRGKQGYANIDEIAEFDRMLHNETPHIGYWVDSSTLTIEQTVEEILAHLDEARITW